jgi:hypothetical protein
MPRLRKTVFRASSDIGVGLAVLSSGRKLPALSGTAMKPWRLPSLVTPRPTISPLALMELAKTLARDAEEFLVNLRRGNRRSAPWAGGDAKTPGIA